METKYRKEIEREKISLPVKVILQSHISKKFRKNKDSLEHDEQVAMWVLHALQLKTLNL